MRLLGLRLVWHEQRVVANIHIWDGWRVSICPLGELMVRRSCKPLPCKIVRSSTRKNILIMPRLRRVIVSAQETETEHLLS